MSGESSYYFVTLVASHHSSFTSSLSMCSSVYFMRSMVSWSNFLTLSASSLSLTLSFHVQGSTAPPPSLLCITHFWDVGGFLLAFGSPSIILPHCKDILLKMLTSYYSNFYCFKCFIIWYLDQHINTFENKVGYSSVNFGKMWSLSLRVSTFFISKSGKIWLFLLLFWHLFFDRKRCKELTVVARFLP